jgi:hypothetical protein
MIELISLHIPKTAGTSFRNTLKSVYGELGVLQVHLPGPEQHGASTSRSSSIPVDFSRDLRSRLQRLILRRFSSCAAWHPSINAALAFALSSSRPYPLDRDYLPLETRVVHGHFRYPDLLEKYGLPKDIPVITWLRNPVQRVISNYYYLDKVLRKAMEKANAPLGLLSRMERSLMEYARSEQNRNRMHQFLNCLELSDLLFVGLVEHMDEDLKQLAELLGWRSYERYFDNASRDNRPLISPDTEEEIARLNQLDMKLYEAALRLRDERCQTGNHS